VIEFHLVKMRVTSGAVGRSSVLVDNDSSDPIALNCSCKFMGLSDASVCLELLTLELRSFGTHPLVETKLFPPPTPSGTGESK
jgi:hypothetical protein